MNLVKQNMPGLPEQVREFGCKFRCLQAIAEFTIGRTLSPYDIMNIYHVFVKKNDHTIMNSNCYMGENEHFVIDNAFYRLTLTEKYKGKMVGSSTGWGVQKGDFIIKDFKTKFGKHFVLFDKFGREIFDPWDGNLERLGLNKILFYEVKK